MRVLTEALGPASLLGAVHSTGPLLKDLARNPNRQHTPATCGRSQAVGCLGLKGIAGQ